ncbi:Uncharacterised protein [Mycobacteroides abscessus subsp. massiliense]|nr:Uncharacterised protein [Mycobacteroides abscessus subsp. massiliense]
MKSLHHAKIVPGNDQPNAGIPPEQRTVEEHRKSPLVPASMRKLHDLLKFGA